MTARGLIQLLVLLLGVRGVAAQNVSSPHFKHWFPQMAPDLQALLDEKCASDYQLYLDGQSNNHINVLNDTTCTSCTIAPVAACLYDGVVALAGPSMQAAGVLLGLLPTILILVSPSKVETGILTLQRPSLAMLTSAGCPAVNLLHSADYNELAYILHSWPGSKKHYRLPNSWGQACMVTIEYCIVIAAVANIAGVCYELGYWTVCSIAPETTYLPMLWPILSLIGYVFGAAAVRLRVCLMDNSFNDSSAPEQRSVRAKLGRWMTIDRAKLERWMTQESI